MMGKHRERKKRFKILAKPKTSPKNGVALRVTVLVGRRGGQIHWRGDLNFLLDGKERVEKVVIGKRGSRNGRERWKREN